MAKHKRVSLKDQDIRSSISQIPTQEVQNIPKSFTTTQKPYLLFMTGVELGSVHLIEFHDGEFLLGRSDDCDLRLESPGISRYHALLRQEMNGPVELIDLNSKNGCYIGDSQVKSHYLLPGEKFRLGPQLTIKFLYQDEEEIDFHHQIYGRIAYDSLTSIMNRRYFFEFFQREWSFAKRHQSFMSVVLLDIDFFKKVNDTYGHPIGDLVLQEFAKRIQQSIRKEDLLARYGGEEFIVFLRDTNEKGARITAERMLKAISSRPFQVRDYSLDITVSIGVVICSCVGEMFKDSQELVDIADQALYEAKKSGRNRVCLKVYSN